MNAPLDSRSIIAGSKYGTAGRARNFTWRHILFRLVWNITWALLASWTPPQLFLWRRFLLRLFGAKMGKRSRVYGSATVWYPPNFEIGEGAVLGRECYAYCIDKIIIEDFVEIAQFVRLMTGTHDIDDPNFQLMAKPIRICKHAWVAAGTFVGPGVTIGEGAVLGGAAVTFKDLEPWTVYGGNPARPIKLRRRFTEDDKA